MERITMPNQINTFRVSLEAAREAAKKTFAPESFELARDPLYVTLPDGEYTASFDAQDVQIYNSHVYVSGQQVQVPVLCKKERPEAVFWGLCCDYYRVYQDTDGVIQFADTTAPDYQSFIKLHFKQKEAEQE